MNTNRSVFQGLKWFSLPALHDNHQAALIFTFLNGLPQDLKKVYDLLQSINAVEIGLS